MQVIIGQSFSLLLLACGICLAHSNEQIAVSTDACSSVQEKKDCGYLGINQGQCEGRGCCWRPTGGSDPSPWCYFPAGAPPGPSPPPPVPPDQCNPSKLRMDCGYVGIQEGECGSHGCCWSPVNAARAGDSLPWCFHPNSARGTYNVSEIKATGPDTHVHMHLASSIFPALGKDFPDLQATMEIESPTRAHVRIAPLAPDGSTGGRWEVPETLMPRPPKVSISGTPPELHILSPTTIGEEFWFAVTRTHGATSDALFNTSGYSMVFKEQYMELSTAVPPSSTLYGLGENTFQHGLRLQRNGKRFTLWNADTASAAPDINLYGSHPFLMEVREDGSAHGVFLLNSNGMDVILEQDSVTFRVIGGIFDFYFFVGPTPDAVLSQYHTVIGRPAMPPRWALGFQQSRYGWHDIGTVTSVLDSYASAHIPLDVLWSDIDYMDRYRDFTFDPERYPVAQLRSLVDRLHAEGRRWVPIVDPSIPVVPGYAPYELGRARQVFIRDSSGKPLLGELWPGPCHWPDFSFPPTATWWTELLAEMHNATPFDGIWIDMNEPSNFCPGDVCTLPPAAVMTNEREESCVGKLDCNITAMGYQRRAAQLGLPGNCQIQCQPARQGDPYSHPPYLINNLGGQAPLGTKTVAMSAMSADGSARMYDTHNLYSLAQAQVTAAAVANVTGERPFVLTRSTFAGSGRYASHWTGDNAASWDNLRWAVTGVLGSNMWGMPHAGVDICGYFGQTNEELCTRWMSAGAFYPFSRNHNDISGNPHEPFRWPSTAEAARRALAMRYRLLPYLYSSFYTATIQGGAVAWPLAFHSPADPASLADEGSWLLGDSVLVAPVMEQGAEARDVYFPAGRWFSLWDYTSVLGPACASVSVPILGNVPLYVSGGTVLPMQEAAETTVQTAASPLTLLVALGPQSVPDLNWAQYTDVEGGAAILNSPAWKKYWEEVVAEPPTAVPNSTPHMLPASWRMVRSMLTALQRAAEAATHAAVDSATVALAAAMRAAHAAEEAPAAAAAPAVSVAAAPAVSVAAAPAVSVAAAPAVSVAAALTLRAAKAAQEAPAAAAAPEVSAAAAAGRTVVELAGTRALRSGGQLPRMKRVKQEDLGLGAWGVLYADNGTSREVGGEDSLLLALQARHSGDIGKLASHVMTRGSLLGKSAESVGADMDAGKLRIERVVLLGLTLPPHPRVTATLNGQAVEPSSIKVDAQRGCVEIERLASLATDPLQLEWKIFSESIVDRL